MQRIVMVILGVAMYVLGGQAAPVALAVFFILYLLNQVLSGVTTPYWVDFIAKVTPPDRRGRLMGLRNSLGGAGAFAGGFVLTWLLTAFPFPRSFALAFLVAAALQLFSTAVQARVVENGPSEVRALRPLREYLVSLPGIVREHPVFVRFVAAMALMILGSMPVGFYAVYALRDLGAPEAMVGEFTIALVLIQIVSALVNGMIADRRGHKAALMIAGGALVLSSLTALLATTGGAFRLVFLFLGINVGTEIMARYNMALEFSPATVRSTFVGLMNVLLAPFYAAGLLGGVLVDWWGFRAVFASGLCCSLAGVLVLAFGVRDPRGRVPPEAVRAAGTAS
jgi:MFS family permease